MPRKPIAKTTEEDRRGLSQRALPMMSPIDARERISLGPQQRFRLVGVGLSNFYDPDESSAQPALFE
jgi:hypothetical protein